MEAERTVFEMVDILHTKLIRAAMGDFQTALALLRDVLVTSKNGPDTAHDLKAEQKENDLISGTHDRKLKNLVLLQSFRRPSCIILRSFNSTLKHTDKFGSNQYDSLEGDIFMKCWEWLDNNLDLKSDQYV